MKTTDAIRMTFQFGDQGVSRIIEDMKHDPLLRPIPGGNHAMWIVGHLTVTEGRLHKMLLGEPNPLEHWKPLFDWATEPKDDPSAYPRFEEVAQTYRRLRTKTLSILEELGDEGLNRPTRQPPPGLEKHFATNGQALMTIANHQVFHSGQASITRRASGKQPAFVPSEALRQF